MRDNLRRQARVDTHRARNCFPGRFVFDFNLNKSPRQFYGCCFYSLGSLLFFQKIEFMNILFLVNVMLISIQRQEEEVECALEKNIINVISDYT